MTPRSSYQLRQVLQHVIQPLLSGWRPKQCQGRALQRSTDYLICKDNHRQRKLWQNVANLYTERQLAQSVSIHTDQPTHPVLNVVYIGGRWIYRACSGMLTFMWASGGGSVLFNGVKMLASTIHDSACNAPTLPQCLNAWFVYPPQPRMLSSTAANKWSTN